MQEASAQLEDFLFGRCWTHVEKQKNQRTVQLSQHEICVERTTESSVWHSKGRDP